MCLLIGKIFLPRLFLATFKLNVGLSKIIFVFFFWFYFAAKFVVRNAVLLRKDIFSVLLRNLVLFILIFQHLKNF